VSIHAKTHATPNAKTYRYNHIIEQRQQATSTSVLASNIAYYYDQDPS
jgi:hypothetical protein